MTRCSPRPGDVVLERYLLLDRPQAHKPVFRAVHLATERTVLVQYLVPELLQGAGDAEAHMAITWRGPASHEVSSLMSRVRLFSRLNHPALLPIHDAGVDECWPFVVRGLVHGQTLAEYLRHQRPSPRELVTWVLMITSGLAAARGVGLVHRDLRPENILLAKRSQQEAAAPYLVDFGLAQLGDAVDPRDLLSPQRAPYRAPERLQSHHGFREPGDVYALAAIVHEGLTGRLARPARRGRRGAAEDWPATVPAELAELVMRCLAAQPGRRLQTLSAWSGALSLFVMEGGSLAKPEAEESVAVPVAAAGTARSSKVAAPREPTGRRILRERRVIQSIRPSSPAQPPTPHSDLPEEEVARAGSATPSRLATRESTGRRVSRERRVIQAIRPSSPAPAPASRLELEDELEGGLAPAPNGVQKSTPAALETPTLKEVGANRAGETSGPRPQAEANAEAEQGSAAAQQVQVSAAAQQAEANAEAEQGSAAAQHAQASAKAEETSPPMPEVQASAPPPPATSAEESTAASPNSLVNSRRKTGAKEPSPSSKRKSGRTAKRKAEAAKRKAEAKAEAAKRKSEAKGQAVVAATGGPANASGKSSRGASFGAGQMVKRIGSTSSAVAARVGIRSSRTGFLPTSSVGALGVLGALRSDHGRPVGAKAVVWAVGVALLLLLTVYGLMFSGAERNEPGPEVPILVAP